MVAWWRFLVAWIHFLVPLTWFHGCLIKDPGCVDLVPWFPQGTWLPEFTFWFYVLGSLAPRLRFLSACTWFVNPWTWLHGRLVNFPGCQGSIHESIIAWWRLLIAWIHFLVPLTWFCGCLIKVPGSVELVPWFPQGTWLSESTFWFYVLCSLAPRLGFLSACTWSLNPWTWFHGCLVKITGFLDSLRGSLDLVPSLSGESLSMPGLLLSSLDMVAWIWFLVAWIQFLVSWTWFPRLSWFSGSL